MENIYFNEQEKNKKSFLFIDNSRMHTWNTRFLKNSFFRLIKWNASFVKDIEKNYAQKS